MKKPLQLWAEEELKSRFEGNLFGNAEWETPSTSSSLKCESYIPIRCPYEKGHNCKNRKNETETMLMVT